MRNFSRDHAAEGKWQHILVKPSGVLNRSISFLDYLTPGETIFNPISKSSVILADQDSSLKLGQELRYVLLV
jgi:hypothetical protein